MKSYFTIIIPTLNEEKRIIYLLNDLAKQTFKDFKVTIVDAKSEDNTKDVAKNFRKLDTKVKVLTSSKKNVSYQRNLGASRATTNWIIFMDADNRIPKRYLEELKHHVEIRNPDILSTWLKPDTNSRQNKFTATLMNIFMDVNKNSSNPYVMEAMVLIKKRSFEKLKGFDTSIPWREGEDLLKRARKMNMSFEFVKNPKYKYSFRRFSKFGNYGMLESMVQLEFSKFIKGKLPDEKAKKYYPMEGGGAYKKAGKDNSKLQKFLSVLFDGRPVNKKTVGSFKNSLDTWERFFR